MPSALPIIKLHSDNKEDTVMKLREACVDVGFFYLQDHGVDEQLLNDVFEQAELLFNLPLSSKQAISDKIMTRGYTSMEEETLDPTSQVKGDTKEGFYIGREILPNDPRYDPKKLRGPNQWPTPVKTPEMPDCEKFYQIMNRYMEIMTEVGLKVVRLLALAIGLEENFFEKAFQEPIATIRILHYANERSQPENGVFGCGAHTDYGMITLLLTDTTPGLQVLSKDKVWIDVPPTRGTFIVNLGDMLERWTNGLFRSTIHRVLIAGDKERYSVPFFFDPNFDTKVECMKECCSERNPPKYKPTTSGHHLFDKYKQTHADFEPVDL